MLGIFRTFDSPILLLPMALSYLILLFGPCVIKLKKANVPKCNTRVYSIQTLRGTFCLTTAKRSKIRPNFVSRRITIQMFKKYALLVFDE